jgi:hypothetical protein
MDISIPINQKLVLSEDEAAEYVGLSKPAFRRLGVPRVQPRDSSGNAVRRNMYRRADVESWVAGLQTVDNGDA